MAKTLIIRYHRIGDALIVLPLIASLAKKYPEDTFTILTNERFESLIDIMPSNVKFKTMIAKSQKGLFRGLSFSIRKKLYAWRMKSFIKSFDKIAFLQYDAVEDKMYKMILNNKWNIQTAITDETEFLSEVRILNKCNDGLTMIKLHQKTLSEVGYKDIVPTSDSSKIKQRNADKLFNSLGIDSQKKLIAISPFSRETSKTYPSDKIEKIIAHFANDNQYQVLVFGGGPKEERQAEIWVEKYPSIISLINKVSFKDETTILAKCQASLSMDSANLHLSALLNTPVISIWGGTSPQNGYYPPNVNPDYAIVKGLDCQPCSIFGNKPCTNKKQYDCLDIAPETIIQKIIAVSDN